MKSIIIPCSVEGRSEKNDNDNIKFKQMLEIGGEVEIYERMRIDLDTWDVVSQK